MVVCPTPSAFGRNHWSVPKGSALDRCDRCRGDVILSPTARRAVHELLDHGAAPTILCPDCLTLAEIKRWNEERLLHGLPPVTWQDVPTMFYACEGGLSL